MSIYSKLKPQKGGRRPFETLPFIIALIILALSVFWLERFILVYLPPSDSIEVIGRSLNRFNRDLTEKAETEAVDGYILFYDLLAEDRKSLFGRKYRQKDPFKPLKSFEDVMFPDEDELDEGLDSLIAGGKAAKLLADSGIFDIGSQSGPTIGNTGFQPTLEPDYGRYLSNNLRLRGYVGTADAVMALVEYEGETYIIEEGDRIADITVKKILPEELVVEYKEKEFHISLGGEDD